MYIYLGFGHNPLSCTSTHVIISPNGMSRRTCVSVYRYAGDDTMNDIIMVIIIYV